jgi:hypothetical protein
VKTYKASKATAGEEGTTIAMWLKGRANGSPRAGERTILRYESQWFKSAGEDYAHYEHVCDRAHLSCVGCGLCASLDGTQPDDVNVLNALSTKKGEPLILGPWTARTNYLADFQPIEQVNYYHALLRALRSQAGGRSKQRNPDAARLDRIVGPAREVAAYILQGGSGELHVCESWNTHEDVLALTVACAREAAQVLQSVPAAREFLREACSGVDITTGIADEEIAP